MRAFWKRREAENPDLDMIGSKVNVAPTLDFTIIPIVEAAGVLRYIGGQMVKDLLDENAESGRQAPDLTSLILAAPSVKTLSDLLGADPRSSLGSGTNAPPLTVPSRLASSGVDFPALVEMLIDGGLQLDQFDISQRQRLLRMLGVSHYLLLPDIFWTLAGISAWMDLNFQFESAYKTRQFLLSRTLFFPNDKTEPVFSPDVFWVLIAQNTVSQIPVKGVQVAYKTWVYNAALSLRSTALQLALLPGWADIWDRWLIAQSFAAWQPGSDEHRRQLETAFPSTPQPSELFIPEVRQDDSTYQIRLAGETTWETYPAQQDGSTDQVLSVNEAAWDAYPEQEELPSTEIGIQKEASLDALPAKPVVYETAAPHPADWHESALEEVAGAAQSDSGTYPSGEEVDVLVNGDPLTMLVVKLSRKKPVRIRLKSKKGGRMLPLSRFECKVGPELDAWVGIKLEGAGWTVYQKKQLLDDLEGPLKIYACDPIQFEIATIKLQLREFK